MSTAQQSAQWRKRRYLNGGRPLRIDATGTRRRVQALHAMGWSNREISARLGREPINSAVIKGRWVSVETHHRIKTLYEQLSMTHGPSEASRRRAAAAGWAPPLAWDDDTIDNPAAEPQGMRMADLESAVRRMHRVGLSDLEISRRLLIHPKRVWKLRRGLGLPANRARAERQDPICMTPAEMAAATSRSGNPRFRVLSRRDGDAWSEYQSPEKIAQWRASRASRATPAAGGDRLSEPVVES